MKQNVIYALGFFDGVHTGHMALLRQCCALARAQGVQTGAVTFLGHPDDLLLGQTTPLINTPADRERLLKQNGIQNILALPFDRALMQMPWEDFIRLLRQEHGAAGFVCGEDFRFGRRGQGTAALLQDYCRREQLPCGIVPEQTLEGTRISSTYIRHLLEQGQLARANRFLGHSHILSGQVITGRQLGRTIGIPTANIAYPPELVQLPRGVYACRAVTPEGTYPAVTNVGTRPTVGGHRLTAEPWLMDFSGDLYGRELVLEFVAFLRPEKKFDSLQALQAQIRADALQARQILAYGVNNP